MIEIFFKIIIFLATIIFVKRYFNFDVVGILKDFINKVKK